MIEDRFIQERLNKSKELFVHYFELACGGLSWDSKSEVEDAVEALFEAAVEQAKLELTDLLENAEVRAEQNLEASQTRADYRQRVREEGL